MKDETGTYTPKAVHYFNGGWWFWDETWSHRLGPFSTENDAGRALYMYCKYLNGWEVFSKTKEADYILYILILSVIGLIGLLAIIFFG